MAHEAGFIRWVRERRRLNVLQLARLKDENAGLREKFRIRVAVMGGKLCRCGRAGCALDARQVRAGNVFASHECRLWSYWNLKKT